MVKSGGQFVDQQASCGLLGSADLGIGMGVWVVGGGSGVSDPKLHVPVLKNVFGTLLLEPRKVMQAHMT
eukprot:1152803-Pelagomonas_calceolata.AAC.2